jgi:uncharacterized protein YndB with AHSA1/START domain
MSALQVVRAIQIQADPSAVWRWLATPEALRQWFSPSLEIDLRVGGAYRFFGPDDKTWISGTVLEFRPEQRLVLSWFEEGAGWVRPAQLTITLAPSESGTRVTVIHEGFDQIGKPDWQAIKLDYERGSDEHRILEKLADRVNEDAGV